MTSLPLTSALIRRSFYLLFVTGFVVLGSAENSVAQDDSKPANAQESQAISFREMSVSIRRNESEINRLYVTMPVGDPDRQKDYLKKIDQLAAKNEELRTQLSKAAIESFRRAPEGNPDAARFVYKTVMAKLDPRNPSEKFDPKGAQDIGYMMLEGLKDPKAWPESIDRPNLIYQVFRASFSVEDFQSANEMLTLLESENAISPNSSLRTQLSNSTQKWEREILIRRFEKNTDDLPRVKLETLDGDIVVELFENHAPQTVANFISLVEKKFFDELEFFHVETGVLAKTGCPQNLGTSDAGYRIANELKREQIRDHFAGSLSMVTDADGTAGSQLQISIMPDMNDNLDGKHTVFGRVIEGMDVVYGLKSKQQKKSSENASQIVKATVLRKRDKVYQPNILRSSNLPADDSSDGNPLKGGQSEDG